MATPKIIKKEHRILSESDLGLKSPNPTVERLVKEKYITLRTWKGSLLSWKSY